MTEIRQVYRCNVCRNIVEVLHDGVGELVCCDQPMNLLTEKTKDAGLEKYVPVIEKAGNEVTVRVGSVLHPMEQDHFIEWKEIVGDYTACRKFLKPGGKSEAEFETKAGRLKAREYCSIHGLWKS